MKFKSVIACLSLAVYSCTFAWVIIPHTQHDWMRENSFIEWLQADNQQHNCDDTDEQEHEQNSNTLPHHEESQHTDKYIPNTNTTKIIQAQLSMFFVAYCNRMQIIDLTPIESVVQKHVFSYIKSEISVLLSTSEPLRAPPVA